MDRAWLKRTAGCAAAAALIVAPPGSGAAAGDLLLRQCFKNAEPLGGDCALPGATPDMLAGVNAVAAAADGSVYAVSGQTDDPADGTLLHFRRGADGRLSLVGCFKEAGATAPDCADPGIDLLGAPTWVEASPDGQSVYVTASDSNTLLHFRKTPAGTLVLDQCLAETAKAGCTDISGSSAMLVNPSYVSVAPDGQEAYLVSGSNAFVRFARSADGRLTRLQCLSESANGSDCTDISTTDSVLNVPVTVVPSPDGQSLYLASVESDALVHLRRQGGGAFALDQCLKDTAGMDCEAAGAGTAALNGVWGLAAAPDGASVYATGSEAGTLLRFARTADGRLTLDQCLKDDQPLGGCADPSASSPVLAGPHDIALAPGSLYAPAEGSGALSHFRRAGDGRLALSACLAESAGGDCSDISTTSSMLVDASAIAAAPDGQWVYAGARGSKTLLALVRKIGPPACQDGAADAVAGTPVAVPLRCTDADGDTVMLAIVAPAAHGALGPIDQAAGTVVYTPAAGASGADSFSFAASDPDGASPPAVARLSIAPAGGSGAPLPLPLRGALMTLGRQDLIVSRGRVRVKVRCAAAAFGACRGSIAIASARPVAAATRRRRLIVGRARFRVRPGTTVRVTARLRRNALAVLRRRRSLRVRVTLTASDAAGRRVRATRTVRVRMGRRG
jgi:DNA-binding beta-propeller fold protein YncE